MSHGDFLWKCYTLYYIKRNENSRKIIDFEFIGSAILPCENCPRNNSKPVIKYHDREQKAGACKAPLWWEKLIIIDKHYVIIPTTIWLGRNLNRFQPKQDLSQRIPLQAEFLSSVTQDKKK